MDREDLFEFYLLDKVFNNLFNKEDFVVNKVFEDTWELLDIVTKITSMKNKSSFEHLPAVLLNILNHDNAFKDRYDYLKTNDYGILEVSTDKDIKKFSPNKTIDYFKIQCIVLENEFLKLKKNTIK